MDFLVAQWPCYLQGLASKYVMVSDVGETLDEVRAGRAVFMDSRTALDYRIRQNFTDR